MFARCFAAHFVRMSKEPVYARANAMVLPDAGKGGEVPDWVHLFPKGHVIPYDAAARPEHEAKGWFYDDAEAVIAASFAGPKKIHIDVNHSTQELGTAGHDAPAHGFIVEMEERASGIWGRVDWNPSGEAMMRNRSYWGISPVFSFERDTGRVLRVKCAALTNDPALRELTALNTAHSTKERTGMDLTKFAKALGLAENATEEAVLEAATSLKRSAETAEAAMSALGKMRAALDLNEAAGEAEMVATATTLTAQAPEAAARLTALTAENATLKTENAALKNKDQKREADAWLSAKIKAGVAIPAGKDSVYTDLYLSDRNAAEAVVASLPNIGPVDYGAATAAKAKPGSDDLSAEEIAAKATAYQVKAAEEGRNVNAADAVSAVVEGKA